MKRQRVLIGSNTRKEEGNFSNPNSARGLNEVPIELTKGTANLNTTEDNVRLSGRQPNYYPTFLTDQKAIQVDQKLQSEYSNIINYAKEKLKLNNLRITVGKHRKTENGRTCLSLTPAVQQNIPSQQTAQIQIPITKEHKGGSYSKAKEIMIKYIKYFHVKRRREELRIGIPSATQIQTNQAHVKQIRELEQHYQIGPREIFESRICDIWSQNFFEKKPKTNDIEETRITKKEQFEQIKESIGRTKSMAAKEKQQSNEIEKPQLTDSPTKHKSVRHTVKQEQGLSGSHQSNLQTQREGKKEYHNFQSDREETYLRGIDYLHTNLHSEGQAEGMTTKRNNFLATVHEEGSTFRMNNSIRRPPNTEHRKYLERANEEIRKNRGKFNEKEKEQDSKKILKNHTRNSLEFGINSKNMANSLVSRVETSPGGERLIDTTHTFAKSSLVKTSTNEEFPINSHNNEPNSAFSIETNKKLTSSATKSERKGNGQSGETKPAIYKIPVDELKKTKNVEVIRNSMVRSENLIFPNKKPHKPDQIILANLFHGILVTSGANSKSEGITFLVGEGNNNVLVQKHLSSYKQLNMISFYNRSNLVWTQIPSKMITFTSDAPRFEITAFRNISDFKDYRDFDPDVLCEVFSSLKLFRTADKNLVRENFVKMKESNDIFHVVRESLIISNHIKGLKEIAWKNLLLLTITKYIDKNNLQDQIIIPKSYLLRGESFDEDLQELVKSKFDNDFKFKNPLIIKPGQHSNRGTGISMAFSLTDTIRLCKETIEKKKSYYSVIVQEYISSPLLFKERKFDIRCYGLVVKMFNRINFYWYSKGYARTSSFAYDPNIKDNLKVHLTNEAVQVKGN